MNKYFKIQYFDKKSQFMNVLITAKFVFEFKNTLKR